MDVTLEHEQVVIRRGRRSGIPAIVAVHSTALGQAIGGCRLRHYPHWSDALADALRLSEAMTYKCALAGLDHGGAKTVVALPPDRELDGPSRRAVLLDVADLIASLDGGYAAGPDIGTSPADMATIGERTPYVFCRPLDQGGSGDSSLHTATGVLVALEVTLQHLFGSPELRGRRVTISGVGKVGAHLARKLAASGAELTIADIDPAVRPLASQLDARWVSPSRAMAEPADILVPAAVGGVLTTGVVPVLACSAIVGPANNQLADDAVADQLHEEGIVWAPDYVVSAGGVIFATARELDGATEEEAYRRILAIGETLSQVFSAAAAAGTTPHRVARRLAGERITRESAG